jgi:CheY-like chemotaxis protein
MKSRVLLIDDEPDTLEMLEDSLQDEFETVRAESSAEGLEVLGRDPSIALVIVDYMLPGGDGLTFVQSLQEAQRDLPVILYTAYLDSQPTKSAGALRLRIVSKTTPTQTLLQAVRELLGGSGQPGP